MAEIIVAFPKRSIALKIKNILVRNGFHVAAVCATGAQVIQAAERLEDGVIVNGIRFVDMLYYDVCAHLQGSFEMIVVASSSQWEDYGQDDVVCLMMPLKMYDLVETVRDYTEEIDQKRKQSKKPRQRNEKERSIINQAKNLLMDQEGYTEEGAHRYLQKHAMDNGNSMVDTAYMVLELFGK